MSLWSKLFGKKEAEAGHKDSQTKLGESVEIHCACCGKDIGTQWHYLFESIDLAATVAAQCPKCGRTVCAQDLKYGPDGNYPPCPNCGVKIQMMSDGPASTSMVQQARSQGRYHGALQEPSVLGRPVRNS